MFSYIKTLQIQFNKKTEVANSAQESSWNLFMQKLQNKNHIATNVVSKYLLVL